LSEEKSVRVAFQIPLYIYHAFPTLRLALPRSALRDLSDYGAARKWRLRKLKLWNQYVVWPRFKVVRDGRLILPAWFVETHHLRPLLYGKYTFYAEYVPAKVPPFFVRGTVRDQKTKQPIQAADVSLDVATAQTDEQGKFTIRDLQKGKYVLTVTKTGYRTVFYDLEVTRNLDITVELAPIPNYYTVEGRVIDNVSERPVESAEITIDEETQITGPFGEFKFEAVEEGDAKVTVTHPDYRKYESTLKVDRHLTILIRLTPISKKYNTVEYTKAYKYDNPDRPQGQWRQFEARMTCTVPSHLNYKSLNNLMLAERNIDLAMETLMFGMDKELWDATGWDITAPAYLGAQIKGQTNTYESECPVTVMEQMQVKLGKKLVAPTWTTTVHKDESEWS
jgi:hypothetical protein